MSAGAPEFRNGGHERDGDPRLPSVPRPLTAAVSRARAPGPSGRLTPVPSPGGWYCFNRENCDTRYDTMRRLMSSREWPATRVGESPLPPRGATPRDWDQAEVAPAVTTLEGAWLLPRDDTVPGIITGQALDAQVLPVMSASLFALFSCCSLLGTQTSITHTDSLTEYIGIYLLGFVFWGGT